MSLRSNAKDGAGIFGLSLAATIGVMVIVMVVIVGGGAFMYAWAPWKGQIEQRNQTVGSGTYRIASYEWYFDQCSAVQTAEQEIDNYRRQLEADPPPAADQAAILNAGITGKTNVWISLVNEYNANSAKEETRAMFKADGLPERIDPTNLTNGVPTTCA